ncbi:TetR/AcrR family transcriptional regulator [Nocardia sp. NPDC004151]|uniref:TetR/AcrR family transcriptional regulator n=1 Tax=Nocardia sp. NPDC004151 TaxID=3364304 RepID=UPI0036CAE7F3
MPRQASGTYAGASAEQRRADRERRMRDAALELLGTIGWENTTVRRICAAARTSPMFFYESFDDLPDLVRSVYGEISATLAIRAVEAITDAPYNLTDQSRAAARVYIEAATEDPRIGRLMFSDAPPLRELRTSLLGGLSTLIAQQARVVGVSGNHDDVLQATTLLVAAGAGELVLAWLDDRLPLTRESLIELVAQVLSSLATSMPEIPPDLDSVSR